MISDKDSGRNSGKNSVIGAEQPTQPMAPATVKVGLWRLPADAVGKPTHPQQSKPTAPRNGPKAQTDFARRKGLDRKVH